MFILGAIAESAYEAGKSRARLEIAIVSVCMFLAMLAYELGKMIV